MLPSSVLSDMFCSWLNTSYILHYYLEIMWKKNKFPGSYKLKPSVQLKADINLPGRFISATYCMYCYTVFWWGTCFIDYNDWEMWLINVPVWATYIHTQKGVLVSNLFVLWMLERNMPVFSSGGIQSLYLCKNNNIPMQK